MAAASRRHDLRHRRGRLRPRRGRRPPRAAHQLRPRLPAGKADEEGGGGIHQRYGTQKCIQFLLSRRRGAREAWALGVTLGLSGGGGSVYGAPDKSRPPALPESRLRRARQKEGLTPPSSSHVSGRRKRTLKFRSLRPGPSRSVYRSVTRQLRQGSLKLSAILSPPRLVLKEESETFAELFILTLPSLPPSPLVPPHLPSPISSPRRLSTALSLPPSYPPPHPLLTISLSLPSSSPSHLPWAQDQCRRALRRARRQARSSAPADSGERGGAEGAANAEGWHERQGAGEPATASVAAA